MLRPFSVRRQLASQAVTLNKPFVKKAIAAARAEASSRLHECQARSNRHMREAAGLRQQLKVKEQVQKVTLAKAVAASKAQKATKAAYQAKVEELGELRKENLKLKRENAHFHKQRGWLQVKLRGKPKELAWVTRLLEEQPRALRMERGQ